VFVRSVYVKLFGVCSSRYRKDYLVLELPLISVVRYCSDTERGDVVVALYVCLEKSPVQNAAKLRAILTDWLLFSFSIPPGKNPDSTYSRE
jgi:hypothetical protein